MASVKRNLALAQSPSWPGGPSAQVARLVDDCYDAQSDIDSPLPTVPADLSTTTPPPHTRAAGPLPLPWTPEVPQMAFSVMYKAEGNEPGYEFFLSESPHTLAS